MNLRRVLFDEGPIVCASRVINRPAKPGMGPSRLVNHL